MVLPKNTKRKTHPKGQVAILFALVFTFLFILFAFVVDFGHLVQTKINLQIAADSAAYSGAAWQARALNTIGIVNYRMRQDFKELVMKIYVTHSRHNRNFPHADAGSLASLPLDSLFDQALFLCQQAHEYRTLSGVQFKPDTNLCRNADPTSGGLPPVLVPPLIASFDPFAVAIRRNLQQLQVIANQQCNAGADDNRALVQHLEAVFRGRLNFHREQVTSLESYLNQATADPAVINGTSPPNLHPINQVAFQSAVRNLNLANQDSFQYEVLLPQGNSYVQLEEILHTSEVPFSDFTANGAGGCIWNPDTFRIQDLPVGFSKSPEVLTYYAVRLRSRPRLFFMPQRWADNFPELVAYAAAKPFGSRINAANLASDPLWGANSFVPNFSLKPNDTIGFRNRKILALMDLLHPLNPASGRPEGNQDRGWPDAGGPVDARGPLKAIRAPNLFEAAFYSVFPDPGGNTNDDYLEPNFAQSLYPEYVQVADQESNALLGITPSSPPYFDVFGSGAAGIQGGFVEIKAPNVPGFPGYDFYSQEDISTHSVTGVSTIPGAQDDPNAFGYATPQQYHSAWAPPGAPGRIGYGVRFVSLRDLVSGYTVNGTNLSISNPPQTSSSEQLQNVLH